MKQKVKNSPGRFWLITGFLSILALATFLRFYNYSHRWGLAYDQAHDVLVARQALRERRLPLLGPFSSAGPFQTGGEWYWLVMIGTALNPGWVISPWIFMSVLYVVFVALIMYVAFLLGGLNVGLIAGLLAAVSTAQTAQSSNLTNQSPIALISLVAILAMIIYIRSGKSWAIFLLSLMVSLAISIHLQGIALVPLLVLTLAFTGFQKLPVVFLGLFIPVIPLLFYDSQYHYVNIRNMLTYYIHNPNAISYEVLGRRWLTYALVFWPTEWSHVTGGFIAIGVASILLVVSTVSVFAYKMKLTKEFLIIIFSLWSSIVLLRYVRTPLFSSYLTFSHPFILLIVSWSIGQVAQRKTYVGLLFLLVIFFGSFVKTWNDLANSTNFTIIQVNRWIAEIERKKPAATYRIYDKHYDSVNKSVPLSLLLDVSGKSSENGLKLGVGEARSLGSLAKNMLFEHTMGPDIIDLSSSTSAQLAKDKWYPIDAKSIYFATEDWRILEATPSWK